MVKERCITLHTCPVSRSVLCISDSEFSVTDNVEFLVAIPRWASLADAPSHDTDVNLPHQQHNRTPWEHEDGTHEIRK
ncbi:hypothetical protein E2C01_090610 [Portunus trituberculatus]|uniref:Uncharacterized protein n=1 Tax=Portunus trituberculatus TaxID=210409 RepID=A0A5B7JBT4_PORTR|nr:hypothetical protein [Portunus trituberculatus]